MSVKTTTAVIKVKSGNNIADDGAFLVYDKNGGYYYTVSRAELLATVDAKIASIEAKEKAFEAKMVSDYKALSDKYAAFLVTYKETNTKLIDLVDSVVNPVSK